MDSSTLPWIAVGGGDQAEVWAEMAAAWPRPPDTSYHALFAVRVILRPLAELTPYQWGWNVGTLLDDAIGRMRLFIESQHARNELAIAEPPSRRTIALRCVGGGETQDLRLFLICKVCAPTAELARLAAGDGWRELQALFPYDYGLQPLTTKAAFCKSGGWSWGETAGPSAMLTEIRRFEGVVVAPDHTPVYAQGTWGVSARANEQIWRALASCPKPVAFSVLLRPTVLFDFERLTLAEMAETALRVAANSRLPTVKLEAEWVARVHADRLSQLRYPYLLQMYLAAPEGLPEFVGRAIGSAFMYRDSGGSNLPGYELRPADKTVSLERSLARLFWLEPDLHPEETLDRRLARLRYMVNASEALAAFRLPFPPKPGLPGVAFAGPAADG